jgi:hypothetical protein
MSKNGIAEIRRLMVKGIMVVMLFIVGFAITLPIVFFYVALVMVFQSSYYADLMAMREFALQFFLLDLIQGFKWAAVSAITMVPFVLGFFYSLFVGAKKAFSETAISKGTS